MIISNYPLLITLIILLSTACNTSTEATSKQDIFSDETIKTHEVFIENEDGNLEKQEVTFSENDTVQIQDPKTGKWVKMAKKEAEALGNNEN